MNPGITEETGLTARTLVEAFKSSPALLAIVLFNVLFMGVVGWSSHSNHVRWQAESERWVGLVDRTMQLCRDGGYKTQSDVSEPFTPPPAVPK